MKTKAFFKKEIFLCHRFLLPLESYLSFFDFFLQQLDSSSVCNLCEIAVRKKHIFEML